MSAVIEIPKAPPMCEARHEMYSCTLNEGHFGFHQAYDYAGGFSHESWPPVDLEQPKRAGKRDEGRR